MSLPGNRIPAEALPEGGHSVPAAAAELPPFWCRHSRQWSYLADEGGYVCDDPEHGDGLTVTVPGALGVDCQPPFGNPPNAAQRAALGA